jgi:hypothetical protein
MRVLWYIIIMFWDLRFQLRWSGTLWGLACMYVHTYYVVRMYVLRMHLFIYLCFVLRHCLDPDHTQCSIEWSNYWKVTWKGDFKELLVQCDRWVLRFRKNMVTLSSGRNRAWVFIPFSEGPSWGLCEHDREQNNSWAESYWPQELLSLEVR